SVLGEGVLVMGAAALAGGILGFLFGVPRTVNPTGATNGNSPRYEGNTNLEQVSDWLTKILVGVGLVQIGRAPGALGHLAGSLSGAFGGGKTSAAFGLASCIYFACLGFLFSYLWTRLYLPRALHDADVVDQVAAKVQTQLVQQQSSQADALTTVDHQLKPEAGAIPPTQDELNAAVAKANDIIKVEIFQRAEAQRRLNWKDPERKPRMALTIPVFRALIAADTSNQFPRNHGELGFALKDSAPPDFAGGLTELTTAINMRGGPASEKGWATYEANRAVCRINLDPAFLAEPKTASADAVKAPIMEDLKVAAADSFARTLLGRPDVAAWLAANGEPDNAGVPGDPIQALVL
ncbi:MAG TPA: hypothetical protein VGS21_04475, partial [Acidimicrobiales bacterium]|nr:hypothetical protein [Acidimicrobiales bacterium]